MTEVLKAERLTKFYGESRGVVDLDFSVEAGEVFGFLGPNGAGKTTTIRLMLDLSPFYYYAAGDPLRHGLAAGHVLVLVVIAAVATLLAAAAFTRRDLSP